MNEPNVLKRICRCLCTVIILCAVSVVPASAQAPNVTLEAKNVTVKELLRLIEANSPYTFAYADADITPGKRVSVKADNRSIESIIAEVLPEVNVEIKGLKILLTTRSGGGKPAARNAGASRTITGRISDDEGAPVVGATVILKGTTTGTASGLDGNYSLNIRQSNAVLEISLIGYNKVELALADNQTQADVRLTADAIAMDNVVVVGYGVQNKRDVTTAISSIKAEDFADMPTADFRDAMAAKMPGVQVLQLGGQPEGNVSVRIRGIQSATSGNDPLYVIDGIPCDARAFANLDGKRNRLKYGVSFSPSYSKSNYVDADAQYGGDGVIASALMAPPVFPVYNSDGSYNWDMNGFLRINTWDTQTNEVLNPVALALEIDDIREKLNILGNVFASYEFIKGLEYKITAGGDYYSYIRNYYRPSSLPLRGYKYLDAQSTPQANYYNNNYFHWTLSNQLSFNRSFGDHTINAVAVYEAEKYTTQTAQIVSTGTIGDDKIRSTKGKTIDQDNTYNNKYAYTFASWLLRAQYSYKGRYMASVSIRGDGSSRFAPNTRWGYFPAVSIGWRISDENFMRGIKWIDDMKFRASVGQTGNAQIGNSEYLALYGTTNIDLGNGLTSQVYPKQIANNDLGWEKNTQYNVGVDISLWRGLLGLNADFYYSKTTDMLFDVPVSSVSGLTTSNMNIGSMQNKGVELSLSSRRSFGDFSYAVSANWSLNRNKVLSLGDENADIIKESSYAGGYYITRVGQPVGCYYLMVQDGIFHNQEELNSYPHFDTTQVGDFRFVDANGNGILEKDADRVIVGNYMPDFYYGFSVNLSWKGFDLAAAFQGVYGNEILNLERRYLLNMEASSNMMRESLQRYPYGELNRATRKSSGNNGACTSTFHLEDGSYLRLQNLSLGYTFPDKWTRRAGISKLRIYVQGSNLFTWTDYSGYNPEVNKRAADALRPGEDYCSYPLSRTFSVGINFNL